MTNCYRKFDRKKNCQKNGNIQVNQIYIIYNNKITILSVDKIIFYQLKKASGGIFTFRKYRSVRIPEGRVLFHSQHHYSAIISLISSKKSKFHKLHLHTESFDVYPKIHLFHLKFRKFRCLPKLKNAYRTNKNSDLHSECFDICIQDFRIDLLLYKDWLDNPQKLHIFKNSNHESFDIKEN